MTRSLATRLVGTLIALSCLGYFLAKASAAWHDVKLHILPSTPIALGIAIIPILFAYAALAMNWVVLLRCVQLRIPASVGAGIYLTAQFAKYLPGNVAQYAGRIVLATRRGYSGTAIGMSMALELALLIAFAAAMSIPFASTIIHTMEAAWAGFWWPKLLLVLLGAALVLSAVLLFAIRRWQILSGAKRWVRSMRAQVTGENVWGKLVLASCLTAAALLLWGISLLILNSGSPASLGLRRGATVVSLYCLAWLVGLLTPGAPAGLGIREAILTEGLTPLFGADQAISSALLFRLLTTIADLLAFGVGLLLLRRHSVHEVTLRSDPQPERAVSSIKRKAPR